MQFIDSPKIEVEGVREVMESSLSVGKNTSPLAVKEVMGKRWFGDFCGDSEPANPARFPI
jgi:hypothetical protein